MSTVSFINTDITGIRFDDKVRQCSDPSEWILSKESHFKIIEEKWLEENSDKSLENPFNPFEEIKRPTIDNVLSVYRNLRENYEMRRRYD